MGVQPSGGTEALDLQVVTLHRLHRPEQGLPKDPFPLSRIDLIVDSTAGCELLCFLDAFFGYHQILMAEEDQEKTAFITPKGCYCYTQMSFGLRNTGTTFQRAMQASLKT